MPPPPAAKEKVLDAFQRLLIVNGERSATLDAVAREAGVSKGGLIYHFSSREALIDGLLNRLEALVDEDLRAMTAAVEGPVRYYVRSCAQADTPLDLTMVAVTRLLQRSHSRAPEVLATAHNRWYDALLAAVGDPSIARLVILLGYGLYYTATVAGEQLLDQTVPPVNDIDDVLALVQELITVRGDRTATG